MKNDQDTPSSGDTPSSEALPDEAHSALARSGETLFAALDTERLGALPDQVDPTDLPLTDEARGALLLSGQSIFNHLDEERVSVIRARRWRRWGLAGSAVAAVFFLVAVPAAMILFQPEKPAVQKIAAEETTPLVPPSSASPIDTFIVAEASESTMTAVPEPSSTMLLLISGLLGLRRRRP